MKQDPSSRAPQDDKAVKPKKLSYKLERELSQIPGKIEQAEALVAELSKKLADPDFYQSDPSGFHDVTKVLDEAQNKLERYESRWLELEEMKMETAEA